MITLHDNCGSGDSDNSIPNNSRIRTVNVVPGLPTLPAQEVGVYQGGVLLWNQ
jgi:hypothetical protein